LVSNLFPILLGKNSDNLRSIAQRYMVKIFVPQKNPDANSEERIIEVQGDAQNIELARQDIFG